MAISTSILDQIGATPMLELRHVVPPDCARILLKVEAANPTGSMKDRMALAMIEAAERDGRLRPGMRVIEYTGGSTGVSLAMVCAAKGYPLSIVTSDAFSLEKRTHMQALGASLTIVPSDRGRMDESLTRAMIDAAQAIQAEHDGFQTDQLNNADQLPAYHAMGEEIWTQTDGRVDAFVHSTGTAASSRGISECLHRHNPKVHCVAIEPAESAVLSGGVSGAHQIEGVGAGFVVPLWDPKYNRRDRNRLDRHRDDDGAASGEGRGRLRGNLNRRQRGGRARHRSTTRPLGNGGFRDVRRRREVPVNAAVFGPVARAPDGWVTAGGRRGEGRPRARIYPYAFDSTRLAGATGRTIAAS